MDEKEVDEDAAALAADELSKGLAFSHSQPPSPSHSELPIARQILKKS
jgi:hypothetical protein